MQRWALNSLICSTNYNLRPRQSTSKAWSVSGGNVSHQESDYATLYLQLHLQRILLALSAHLPGSAVRKGRYSFLYSHRRLWQINWWLRGYFSLTRSYRSFTLRFIHPTKCGWVWRGVLWNFRESRNRLRTVNGFWEIHVTLVRCS